MLSSLKLFRTSRCLIHNIVRPVTVTGPKLQNVDHGTKQQSFPNPSLYKKVKLEQDKYKVGLTSIPNLLTLSRIAAAPFVGYFIWNGMNTEALACFAFAATTDLLDGFIARKFNLQSDIGTMLDPIADKILLSTCLIAMYNTSLLPIWLIKALIYRDVFILVGGAAIRYFSFNESPPMRKFFDFKNHPTIGFEPIFSSKCATALICLLIPTTIATQHLVGLQWYDDTMYYSQLGLALLSIHSLAQYIIRSGRHSMGRIRPPHTKYPSGSTEKK